MGPTDKPLAAIALLGSICASSMSLTGCAGLAAADLVTLVVRGTSSNRVDESETNQQSFAQPIEQVFSALLETVEKDGRKIVDRDPVAYSIKVSYPFSWQQNNWGGTFTVSCTKREASDGSSMTVVHIFGSQADPHLRIRRLGDAILANLATYLSHS